MNTAIAAMLGLLCGIPVGAIIGILACYVGSTMKACEDADPDYSGGL